MVIGTVNLPTTTLVPSSMYAAAAFRHFSRCFKWLLNVRGMWYSTCTKTIRMCKSTYTFQYVLVYASVAQQLQMSPIERGFPGSRTAAEYNNVKIIRLRKCGRNCSSKCQYLEWCTSCRVAVHPRTYLQILTSQPPQPERRLDQSLSRTIFLLPAGNTLREFENADQHWQRNSWVFLVHPTKQSMQHVISAIPVST
jgi:hypothetical protein